MVIPDRGSGDFAMKYWSLIVFCLSVSAGFCVNASADQLVNGAPKETLLVPPFPASVPWKEITDAHSDQQIQTEWIPPDQSPDDIHDILTEQVFFALKGQSATDFVSGIFTRTKQACANVSVNGPRAGTENGYNVAYGQIYCVGQVNADKDVDIFIKAISGKDALYVVQREFRRPATPGAIPGSRAFPENAREQALAALEAQKTANKFLVSQVELCADVSNGACTPGPIASSDPNDVSASFGFQSGKTTVRDVEDKFGAPTSRSHVADGRHADMYVGLKGLIVSFLFGKDDILIRTVAYSHN